MRLRVLIASFGGAYRAQSRKFDQGPDPYACQDHTYLSASVPAYQKVKKVAI